MLFKLSLVFAVPSWGARLGTTPIPRRFFPPAPQQPQKIAGNSAWGGQRLELLLAVDRYDDPTTRHGLHADSPRET